MGIMSHNGIIMRGLSQEWSDCGIVYMSVRIMSQEWNGHGNSVHECERK